jgi:hypothetical protein
MSEVHNIMGMYAHKNVHLLIQIWRETYEKRSLLPNSGVRLQILILEILNCMSVAKIFACLGLEP